jgi:hypothetical protein
MYIKVLWTTLIIYYIDFIQGILNIFDLFLWYVKIFGFYLKNMRHIFDHIIGILN